MNTEQIQYCENKSGDRFITTNSTIKVLRKKPKPIPKTLCKHYNINETHNIDALVNNYIYAAHPKQFNDPFDSYTYFFKDTPENHKALYQIIKRLNKTNQEYKPKDIELAEKDYKTCLEIFDYLVYTGLGLFSMTDGENNNAMHWDHYTQNRGFAIEFKTDKLFCENSKVHGPFQIEYSDNIEKIEEIDEKKIYAHAIYKSLIKKKCWDTEYEWRFFVNDYLFHPHLYKNEAKFVRRIPYNFDSIERVILGFYFFKCEMDNNTITKCPEDTYEVDLNKTTSFDQTQQNKKDLLTYCAIKGIPISTIELNENSFEYTPREIEYTWKNGVFRYKTI